MSLTTASHIDPAVSSSTSPPSSTKFLDSLFGGALEKGEGICIRGLEHAVNGEVQQRFFSDPDVLRRDPDIKKWNTKLSIYFGVAIRNLTSPDKAKKAGCVAITCLWADLDAKDFVTCKNPKAPTEEERKDGRKEIGKALKARLPEALLPSILINTGGGYQAYWLLREPIRIGSVDDDQTCTVETIESYLAGLQKHIGADPSRKDVTSIMRLPGTANCKYPDRPICGVIRFSPERRFNLSDFDEYRLAPSAPAAPKPQSDDAGEDFPKLLEGFKAKGWYYKPDGDKHFVTCPWKGAHTTAGNESETVLFNPSADNGAAGGFACAHSHCVDKTIKDVYALFFPPIPKPKLPATAEPTVGGTATLNVGNNGTKPIEKPKIVANQHEDWDDLIQGVFATIIKLNQPPILFERGAELVRVREDEKGDPMIERLSERSFKGYLANAMWWVEEAVTKNGVTTRPIQPSDFVVTTILTRPHWNGIPPLLDIVQAPVFAPDGTIMTTPGYHPAARVWYHPRQQLDVQVPERPTQHEIEQARELLVTEVLGDFRFDSNASRAHVIAAILMPFARTLFSGPTPLHLCQAPTPGSGKGLCVDCIALITTGRTAPISTVPKDDDEMRKRITASLRRSSPIIVFDNINRRLDSGDLAGALTMTEWSDRILGVSEMTPMLPNRALWIATGNNVEMTTEIARRTVTCRIDPEMERPWERDDFRHHELRIWVMENRSALVSAALTLIRAWLVAGRPKAAHPAIGTFEEWANAVAGILAVAGVEGFLENYRAAYEAADAELEPWRAFVEVWHERYSTKPVPASDLFALALLHELLDDVLGVGERQVQALRFGVALKKRVDQVVGGYTIRCDEPKKKRKAYRLWI